ncbi:MAG: HAD-IC family P-type ATPase [Patescibacteria group bacterium]|jgi:Ca2+-transporting ATPase
MEDQYFNHPIEQALKALKTDLAGLEQDEAEKRQNEFGQNKLPAEKSFSAWLILIRQFKSALIYILLIAALVSFFLDDIVNMYVILAAVGLNVLVGFIQEYRAQRSLAILRQVVTQYATVRRQGHEKRLATTDLVPGDIVIISAGQRVPADLRIISSTDLSVNEASLTGESVPVNKTDKALKSAVILAEQTNMLFLGTTVVSGSGEGIVVGTGQKTELGKIANLIKKTEDEPTPLQKKLSRLAKNLGIIILILAFVVFLAGIILKYDFRDMFTTAVALAVAALPEGLVVVLTVILAIGMQRILKHKALVRKLIAAETLGSTTVICTDKTGTLTEGEMKVVKIITHDESLDANSFNFEEHSEEISAKSYFLALKIGVLASDAYIEDPEEGVVHRTVIGNPTEKALILSASQTGMDLAKIRKENRRLEVVPFSSDRKYMASLHENQAKERTIYYKGAPEFLMKFSARAYLDGRVIKLDAEKKKKLIKEYEKLSSEGLRILALCYKEVRNDYSQMMSDQKAMEDLVFVGFVGIKDPLRQEAKKTIEICQRAGIRTVMLTGDHRLTAKAIAREIGLPAEDKNIIEGVEFEKLDEAALHRRITDISVYARVNPRDKLRIIDAWQAKGEVVAMTGDGINDAPALKSADIGVALGSGTDVAKETADIVLLDNNFNTIVKAVEQGRIIYDNIKKVILYLMSDSFTEMVIISVSLLLGWPLPLLAAQILWINLVTDGFPNVALTLEPGEAGIMQEQPVKLKQPILDRRIITLIIGISLVTGLAALGLFYWLWQAGGDLALARTVIFTAVAIDSLFYVFSSRSLRRPIWRQNLFSNPYLIIACFFGLAVQFLAIYVPFFQQIFGTVPMVLTDWFYVLLFSLLTIMVMEFLKWLLYGRGLVSKNKHAGLVVNKID